MTIACLVGALKTVFLRTEVLCNYIIHVHTMILIKSPSADMYIDQVQVGADVDLGNHAVLVHKGFCLGLSLELKLTGYID